MVAPAAAATSAPAQTVTPTPTPGPTQVPGPTEAVTLAFGGDVHFEGMLDAKVRADADGMLSAIAPVLEAADVAAVNLETAVTDGGDPAPKQYVFAAPAEAFDALAGAGVDVATLANNHGMDFGVAGLRDTLEHADEAGFPIIGAGRDETAAYAPWVTTAGGRTLGFIGATQVLDSFALEAWVAGPERPGLASAKENGVERLLSAVQRADAEVDTVVVFVHWGREGDSCPLPRQPELAQALSEAGADIIVGGHAHRLQAGGFLGDTYVHYGLGNFVFYARGGPGAQSGVLKLTIAPDDTVSSEFVPAVISGGVPVPLEGADADAAVARWEALRECTDLLPRS
jgi:poly-gamma-glutamate synthesis protein (capsule biosynthesis protein)